MLGSLSASICTLAFTGALTICFPAVTEHGSYAYAVVQHAARTSNTSACGRSGLCQQGTCGLICALALLACLFGQAYKPTCMYQGVWVADCTLWVNNGSNKASRDVFIGRKNVAR
jgi:hypothetical protein